MTFVALAIIFAPVALYVIMRHNHDNGHCGWNRCQATTIERT